MALNKWAFGSNWQQLNMCRGGPTWFLGTDFEFMENICMFHAVETI